MARLISRCKDIHLLDGVARCRLDEFVIPAFDPVDREAHDNMRLTIAVMEAQRSRIALAYPIR
jgi:hypothetical protein